MASNFATRLLPTTPFCHCDCHCHFQKFEYFSLRGEFVYIRDDREQQEYFGLCEVQVGTSILIIATIIIIILLFPQVFPIENGTLCGQPEVPLGGNVQVSVVVMMCGPLIS